MNPLINTVKELIASKDKDNIKIASEILRTYPILIDITFFLKFDVLTRRTRARFGDGDIYGDGRGTGGLDTTIYGNGISNYGTIDGNGFLSN